MCTRYDSVVSVPPPPGAILWLAGTILGRTQALFFPGLKRGHTVVGSQTLRPLLPAPCPPPPHLPHLTFQPVPPPTPAQVCLYRICQKDFHSLGRIIPFTYTCCLSDHK